MALQIYDKHITLTNSGETVPSATLQVNNTGASTGLATLWQDRAGTIPAANPFTADSLGRVQFYLESGRYTMLANYTGGSISYPDVTIGPDPDDLGVSFDVVETKADYAALRATPSTDVAVGDHLYVRGFPDPWEVKSGTVTDNGGSILVFDDDANRYAESTSVDIDTVVANSDLFAGPNAIDQAGAVIIVGDSLTEGVGASNFERGYIEQLNRSIWNHLDNGDRTDRGYRYETLLNMGNQLAQTGISSNGSITSGGAVQDRLSLSDGQSITITGREITAADVYYDADLSSGVIEFALNGNNYASKTVSGTGIRSTFSTYPYGADQYIKDTDTITITANGGAVVVTGILTLRQSSRSPLVYIAGKSGWSFNEHAAAAQSADLAAHVNSFRSSSPKLLLIALGTNSIYNAGIAVTPAQYVTDLDNLIGTYAGLMSALTPVVWMPPRSDEGVFPATQGDYDDYVTEVVQYCETNNYQLIRLDESTLSKDLFYSDGVHPTNQGHAIIARLLCENLRITYNPYRFEGAVSEPLNVASTVTFGTGWSAANGDPTNYTPKSYRQGEQVFLSGGAELGGGATTTVMTLDDTDHRPSRALTFQIRTNVGTIDCAINTSGVVTIGGTTGIARVFFDGVNYRKDNSF